MTLKQRGIWFQAYWRVGRVVTVRDEVSWAGDDVGGPSHSAVRTKISRRIFARLEDVFRRVTVPPTPFLGTVLEERLRPVLDQRSGGVVVRHGRILVGLLPIRHTGRLCHPNQDWKLLVDM